MPRMISKNDKDMLEKISYKELYRICTTYTIYNIKFIQERVIYHYNDDNIAYNGTMKHIQFMFKDESDKNGTNTLYITLIPIRNDVPLFDPSRIDYNNVITFIEDYTQMDIESYTDHEFFYILEPLELFG